MLTRLSVLSWGILILAAAYQSLALSTADVCKQIASSVSSASKVSFPREWPVLEISLDSLLIQSEVSISYTQDISHWASSSSQASACSVEPGTPQDVGIIVRLDEL